MNIEYCFSEEETAELIDQVNNRRFDTIQELIVAIIQNIIEDDLFDAVFQK